jgi:hypothetical protein
MVPLDDGARINNHPTTSPTTTSNQEQLDEQQQHQLQEAYDTVGIVPTQYDVKCDPGSWDTIRCNGFFIAMCENKAEAYAVERRRKSGKGKRRIVMEIVNAVQAKQGRFISSPMADMLKMIGKSCLWVVPWRRRCFAFKRFFSSDAWNRFSSHVGETVVTKTILCAASTTTCASLER